MARGSWLPAGTFLAPPPMRMDGARKGRYVHGTQLCRLTPPRQASGSVAHVLPQIDF